MNCYCIYGTMRALLKTDIFYIKKELLYDLNYLIMISISKLFI